MNKSLEYIKNRIINHPESVNNMPITGWDDALIINPIEKYLDYIPTLKECFVNDNEFSVQLSNDEGKFKINIEYNTETDFEYFTIESSTHDGTLMFLDDAIQELLYRLLKLGTIPKSKQVDNVYDYHFKYIIGDIIIHRDFGMKDINGHQRNGETDIVVLPIKFEYILK